jgi:hypothetical protein
MGVDELLKNPGPACVQPPSNPQPDVLHPIPEQLVPRFSTAPPIAAPESRNVDDPRSPA